jgi:hypothetical protein
MDTNNDARYGDEDLVDPFETVTNDAVAGETVLTGAGDGNDGPTGGSPSEGEPEYDENDLAGEEIDLSDTEDTA